MFIYNVVIKVLFLVSLCLYALMTLDYNRKRDKNKQEKRFKCSDIYRKTGGGK